MALDTTNVAFGFSGTFFAFHCKHGLKFFCQQLSVDARVFYCHFMQLKYIEQTNREKYKVLAGEFGSFGHYLNSCVVLIPFPFFTTYVAY